MPLQTSAFPLPQIFWLQHQIRTVVFAALCLAKQNFKMSTSEYLRYAPEYTISRLNDQKFSEKGHSFLTRSSPADMGTPLPAPCPIGAFRLDFGGGQLRQCPPYFPVQRRLCPWSHSVSCRCLMTIGNFVAVRSKVCIDFSGATIRN